MHLVAKRLFDIFGSLAALVLFMPMFVLVAIAIRLTSEGPVLFRQKREGRNGSIFKAFKFRSMRTAEGDSSGIAWTVASDARVTAVGRFIRRTSIDELPQLLNVLSGEMSLVGPRPHVPDMLAGGTQYRVLVPYYGARLAMRPGLTGWAQANGLRGRVDDPALAVARVDHDIAYVQNFSFWLDVKIILRTVKSEFLTGSGE